jgi:hypothetical protein
MRLFVEEDGVAVLAADFPGVRAAPVEGDREWSGVRDGAKRSVFSLLGGCKDFAFKLLADVNLGMSELLVSPTRLTCRIDKVDSLSTLDLRAPPLGRLLGGAFSVDSGGAKVPGPIDFRGALGAGALLKELGGK